MNPMKTKTLVMSMAAILLFAAASAQAELKDVSFRNKKDGSLKLYCRKVESKMKTTILYDGQPFTPSTEWEEINAEKVCFQHEDGRIRACDELSKIDGSRKRRHFCFDQDKKLVPFTPGKEWKQLAGKDTICTEEHERFDVPRNMKLPNMNFE